MWGTPSRGSIPFSLSPHGLPKIFAAYGPVGLVHRQGCASITNDCIFRALPSSLAGCQWSLHDVTQFFTLLHSSSKLSFATALLLSHFRDSPVAQRQPYSDFCSTRLCTPWIFFLTALNFGARVIKPLFSSLGLVLYFLLHFRSKGTAHILW